MTDWAGSVAGLGDDTPTRPVTLVRDRRLTTRQTVKDPYQPSIQEIRVALDALCFYGVEFGAFGADAVRRALVAAAIQRDVAAGLQEARERTDAHLAHAGPSE